MAGAGLSDLPRREMTPHGPTQVATHTSVPGIVRTEAAEINEPPCRAVDFKGPERPGDSSPRASASPSPQRPDCTVVPRSINGCDPHPSPQEIFPDLFYIMPRLACQDIKDTVRGSRILVWLPRPEKQSVLRLATGHATPHRPLHPHRQTEGPQAPEPTVVGGRAPVFGAVPLSRRF